jgi:hypothetical protein
MIAVRTYELPFRENNLVRLLAIALAAYASFNLDWLTQRIQRGNWRVVGS